MRITHRVSPAPSNAPTAPASKAPLKLPCQNEDKGALGVVVGVGEGVGARVGVRVGVGVALGRGGCVRLVGCAPLGVGASGGCTFVRMTKRCPS